MIDYWEAIGRLAYDTTLAEEVMKVLPQGPLTHVNTSRDARPCTGIVFKKEDYEAIRAQIEPHLAEQTLSVTSAGELMWSASYPVVKDYLKQVSDIIRQAGPMTAPSTSYFITLGMLLTDEGLRGQALEGKAKHVNRLAADEREHVLSIIQKVQGCEVVKQAALIWHEGCMDLYLPTCGTLAPLGIRTEQSKTSSKYSS